MSDEDIRYCWSIDDYVNDKYFICREERQYALYLSNVLRYYGKHTQKFQENAGTQAIFNSIFETWKPDENHTIEYVFYEATFMRDIFDANRRKYLEKLQMIDNSTNWSWKEDFLKEISVKEDNCSISFNFNLLAYCWEKYINNDIEQFEHIFKKMIDDKGKFEEKNYGGRNEIPLLSYLTMNESIFKVTVRAMMNAKPDLAVIYKENGIRYLLFIECKYCSGEDCYNVYEGKEIIKAIPQTEIQGYIAEFLCKSPYLSHVEVSGIMRNNNNKSKLIRFIDAKNCKEKVQEDQDNNVGRIGIADLIRLEQRIFEAKSLKE